MPDLRETLGIESYTEGGMLTCWFWARFVTPTNLYQRNNWSVFWYCLFLLCILLLQIISLHCKSWFSVGFSLCLSSKVRVQVVYLVDDLRKHRWRELRKGRDRIRGMLMSSPMLWAMPWNLWGTVWSISQNHHTRWRENSFTHHCYYSVAPWKH